MFDVQKIKEGLEVIGSDKAHLGTDVSEKIVLTVSAGEDRQQPAVGSGRLMPSGS